MVSLKPVFLTSFCSHNRDYLEEESEDEDKETREGPGFQAELPPQRPRPDRPGPPPDEAKWLTGRLLAPGQVKGGPSRPAVDLASLPIEERWGFRVYPLSHPCNQPCLP